MGSTVTDRDGKTEVRKLDAIKPRMASATLVDVEVGRDCCHAPDGTHAGSGPSQKQIAIGRVFHGARVRAGLPLKYFGDEGRVSKVESGELIPKWLERACEHKVMLRCLAIEALMAVGFRKRTSLEADEEVA